MSKFNHSNSILDTTEKLIGHENISEFTPSIVSKRKYVLTQSPLFYAIKKLVYTALDITHLKQRREKMTTH